MEKDAKVFVAGHNGLVGSAIVRELRRQGYNNLILVDRSELDLTDFKQVDAFFDYERPDYVFLAAAKVGGILANRDYPADFIYENLQIQNNVISCAAAYGVKKLLFLGSVCIYPKFAENPVKEEYLLTGELEPTNRPYALAKIAGIELCQASNRQYGTNFISVMPANLYGPNDNFDLETSHVLPALIRKFHEAKENGTEVTMWGTGSPKREFLYVDDLAEACVFLMNNYNDSEIINIGTGSDITIKHLGEMIADIVGYKGKINWDISKPDGTPKRLLDSSKIHKLGWKHRTELKEGIKKTYEWWLKNE